MSQQTSQGIIDTWCDEKDCSSHAELSRVIGADQHRDYTNKIRNIGWSMRRKKSSETYVVNGWRHRCPSCSLENNKGKLK